MPLYDYRCERGHRYEKRESFGAPAEQPCERCGRTARRLINAPAIAFKGSGWYKTDSRGKEPRRSRGAAAAGTRSNGADGASADASGDGGASTSDAPASGAKDRAKDGKAAKSGQSRKRGKAEKAAAD